MILITLVFRILFVVCVASGDHQHSGQLPLGYVKYPYQAIYPGDGEGNTQYLVANTLLFSSK